MAESTSRGWDWLHITHLLKFSAQMFDSSDTENPGLRLWGNNRLAGPKSVEELSTDGYSPSFRWNVIFFTFTHWKNNFHSTHVIYKNLVPLIEDTWIRLCPKSVPNQTPNPICTNYIIYNGKRTNKICSNHDRPHHQWANSSETNQQQTYVPCVFHGWMWGGGYWERRC